MSKGFDDAVTQQTERERHREHQLPLNLAYDDGHRTALKEALKGLIRQAERHEERSAETLAHQPGDPCLLERYREDRRFTRLLLQALRRQ